MAKYPKPRKWTPTRPEKYEGDVTNIIARSSWEILFFNWCDRNSSILQWSSEETVIPYRSPLDSKPHRYFMDGKIKVQTDKGVQIYLVEIKPNSQRYKPVFKGKQTKSYLNECTTFMVNQAKWAAADRWAKDRGWIFQILDEYDLGIKVRKA